MGTIFPGDSLHSFTVPEVLSSSSVVVDFDVEGVGVGKKAERGMGAGAAGETGHLMAKAAPDPRSIAHRPPSIESFARSTVSSADDDPPLRSCRTAANFILSCFIVGRSSGSRTSTQKMNDLSAGKCLSFAADLGGRRSLFGVTVRKKKRIQSASYNTE